MTDGAPLPNDAEPGIRIPVGDAGVVIRAPERGRSVPAADDRKEPGEKSADKDVAVPKWEMAKTVAETIQRGMTVLLVIGGLVYGIPIVQAQHTKALRDEAVAKAEIATREAAEKQILDLELSAQLLGTVERDRYVLVTLELKNTGNRVLSIPAEHLAAAITNVSDIEADGQIRYGRRQPLRFGVYPDAKVSEMTMNPGERRKLQSVQKLRSEGLHVVTAEISLGQRGDHDEAFRATLFTHLN